MKGVAKAKGANYKYCVMKGEKVAALATSITEAKAEARRIGGSVHPLVFAPHKNPADPRFSNTLGGGMFSTAYGADDPESAKKFYAPKGTGLDRLNYGVESVSRYMPKGLRNAKGVIDVAKTILALARMELNAAPGGPDKLALAFLPSIRPVRMDKDAKGKLELIYKMPVYRIWGNDGDNYANSFATVMFRKYLGDRGGPLNVWKIRLGMALKDQDIPARWHNKIRALIRVTDIMEKLVNSLPLTLSGLDLHRYNAALDKRGNLILLDPIVAEMKEKDAVALWHKLGWDVKPSVVKRPRR